MALPDVLSQAAFSDLFKVRDWQFTQNFNQQQSMTGGGETRYADRAPSLWRGNATTARLNAAGAAGVTALLNSRAGGLKTVLLHDRRLPYPASDVGGLIIGSTTPALGAITDRLHVAFTGFPANYVMPAGTYFGIVFDTSRYYLGQFCETRTANGAGAIASVEIWPPLPASIAGTPDVNVKKPPAKFRITPNSAYPASFRGRLTDIQFAFEQTYSR